jgi:hypothetical protein
LLLQVQGIMVTLTINQFLTPEHLDMLWAVTEKVRQQQLCRAELLPYYDVRLRNLGVPP